MMAAMQCGPSEWGYLPARFSNIQMDASIVMPNHIHGIVLIDAARVGATTRVAPTIGDIVGAFKSVATLRYIRGVKVHGWPRFHGRLLQRNYYEHVIRNEKSLDRIRQYIADNPLSWAIDPDNPASVTPEPKDAWRT